jgi:hypothetical protein
MIKTTSAILSTAAIIKVFVSTIPIQSRLRGG